MKIINFVMCLLLMFIIVLMVSIIGVEAATNPLVSLRNNVQSMGHSIFIILLTVAIIVVLFFTIIDIIEKNLSKRLILAIFYTLLIIGAGVFMGLTS